MKKTTFKEDEWPGIRHGDLMFYPIKSMPKGKVHKTKSYVVAEGETTGHKHVLASDQDIEVIVKEIGDDLAETYLEVKAPSKLTHEEHRTLTLDPGKYKVIREREHDYLKQEERRVID